ncbi:hypothetical protein RYZ26_19005 [Terasakiella sp. A23]|nr:hypothetical protein [Terasakiella sp. A23]MDV7341698.1 hypothetical protein [Terasakiella sp. A23]
MVNRCGDLFDAHTKLVIAHVLRDQGRSQSVTSAPYAATGAA